ncbi:zinc finger BED domain-containing protein RICESLEEPER 2 [Tanacetum coccineum]
MDQQNPQQNTPYESISSSMPTYESFSSQQNTTIEDETIDVETLGSEDKKRKRKAPSNPRKPKAECWKYFDQKFEKDEDGVITKMAYCKWCPAVFKADSHRHGTRHLNNHYPNCESNPDVEKLKKQKKLAFKKSIGEKDEGGTNSGTLETWKYDEKVIKESLIKLIVLAELPFKFVEHPAFIKFSSDMQPRFNMPSRFKIARDISKFYLEERKSLFNFLSKDSTTVHLTTDTWTSSCKRMNFMVLTAHFIDDDWVMHKRIINFRPIHSHRGVDIGRALLECITGWGIKNVMTVTVDNIASNDKALEYLVENLPTKYDNGKHFHIRCMAHILNLIVKDGLKTYKKEVDTIALAVKYIKHSSQRVTNFKESVENATDSKKFLISECPTRWNSTHDMLKTAIELKDAFFDYDFNNSCFARDLEETPKRADFEVCRKVVQFLEKFKETTELVSNVSSPVAHLWFGEVLDIDKHLREWQANASFKNMIGDMRKKYDKYWGDYKKINHYMYFAVILDPTMKSEIVKYGFKHLIENGCMPMDQDEEDSQETPFQFLTPDELCDKFVEKVEKDMGLLFAMYKEKYGTTTSSDLPRPMSSKSGSSKSRRGNAFLNSFKDKLGNKSSGGEDELRKYLKEPRLELEDDEDFDILTWWKLNSPRFPIVSRMAKGHGSGHGSARGSAHGSDPVHDGEDDFPVEEVSPVKPKKPSRCAARAKKDEPNDPPKDWTMAEETAVCQAWCDVSENNIKGNGMKTKGFWDAVITESRSGTNDLDVYHKACAKYKMKYKSDFTLEHCYNILKDHPGWKDVKMPYFNKTQGRKKSKTSETTSGSASGGLNLNEEADEAVEETQEFRPIGRDRAKAKKKAAAGSSQKKDEQQLSYIEFKNRELSIREAEAREIAQLKREKLEIQRRMLELAEREKRDRGILFYNSLIDPTLPPIQQQKLLEMKLEIKE